MSQGQGNTIQHAYNAQGWGFGSKGVFWWSDWEVGGWEVESWEVGRLEGWKLKGWEVGRLLKTLLKKGLTCALPQLKQFLQQSGVKSISNHHIVAKHESWCQWKWLCCWWWWWWLPHRVHEGQWDQAFVQGSQKGMREATASTAWISSSLCFKKKQTSTMKITTGVHGNAKAANLSVAVSTSSPQFHCPVSTWSARSTCNKQMKCYHLERLWHLVLSVGWLRPVAIPRSSSGSGGKKEF